MICLSKCNKIANENYYELFGQLYGKTLLFVHQENGLKNKFTYSKLVFITY